MSISAPAGVTGLWDLAIFSLPGDNNFVHWAAGPSPLNLTQSANPANSAYGRLSASAFGSVLPTPIPILRRDLNGSGVAEQWGANYSSLGVAAFRHTYRGLTLHNASSALYNGGSLVAANLDAPYSEARSIFGTTRAGAGTTNRFCLAVQTAEIPLAEADLVNVPGVYVADAKDGCFMPLRVTNTAFVRPCPSLGMCGVGNGGATVDSYQVKDSDGTGQTPSHLCSYPMIVPAGGTAATRPWWLTNQVGEAQYIDDLAFGGLSTGVILCRNMPQQAAFQLTVYAGIEIITAVDSPVRSMVRAPEMPDPRAIQAYYEILGGMPRAYPASYNAVGAILPLLASAVRAALPHIVTYAPRVLSAIGTAVPAVKQIVDMMHDVASPATATQERDQGLRVARAPSYRAVRSRARTARVPKTRTSSVASSVASKRKLPAKRKPVVAFASKRRK